MTQNAAGCMVFSQQICTLCPFFISIHWLLGAAYIKYKPCSQSNQRNFAHLHGPTRLSILFIPNHFMQTLLTSEINCSNSLCSFPHNNQETHAASISEGIWIWCSCICLTRCDNLYHEVTYWPVLRGVIHFTLILCIEIILFVLPKCPNL